MERAGADRDGGEAVEEEGAAEVGARDDAQVVAVLPADRHPCARAPARAAVTARARAGGGRGGGGGACR